MKRYYYVIMTLIPFIFIEIFFRSISTKSGENLRILDKSWYVLLPLKIHAKSSFPKIHNTLGYKVYDPILGWKINKNGKEHPYYSNSQGLRVKKEHFSNKKKVETTNILTIGDSFTHGDEVLFEETWPYFLEKMSKRKVVNLGTSAYGIDQAILSYINSPIKTDTVILGLIAGDLERATSLIYPKIYYQGLKSKPIFSFTSNNEYAIMNQPCLFGPDLYEEFKLGEKSNFMKLDRHFDKKLFKNEFLDFLFSYRIYKMLCYRKKHLQTSIYQTPDTNDYIYILKIFEIFYDECNKNNDTPIIAFLDNNNTFSDRGKYKNPWNNLKIDLEKIGFEVIGPSDSLVTLHEKNHNNIININGVHYTPLANRIVARHIKNNI